MYGADAMVSRGTRVWEARDISGKIVVIKDAWRDKDRDPEGAIQKGIFKDIRDKLGEEAETEAKKYFLEVLTYEDVNVHGKVDKTLKLAAEEGLKCFPVVVEPALSERRHLSSVGHIPDPDSEQLPTGRTRRAFPVGANIPSKVHARTVFQEVGIPLADVTLLANCLACLHGSQKGKRSGHTAFCI